MYVHEIPEVLQSLPRNRTVMLEGPPGVGKTDIFYEYIKITGDEYYEDSLVSALPEDIRGLPDFDRENDCTIWRLPEWFRKFSYRLGEEEPNPDLKATIFLDEIRSAQPTVQVCAQKIAQERRLGMCQLHPNVRVVFAGNRKEDKALVSDMPAPLRSKIIWISVEPHLGGRYPEEDAGWIQKFAIPHGIHDHIIQFLRFKDEFFSNFDPKIHKQSFPCPRTWHILSDVMKNGCPDNHINEIAGGIVGKGAASEFFAYREVYSEIPTIEDIRKDPEGAKHKKEPSFQYAINGFLISAIRVNNKDLDSALRYAWRNDEEFKMMLLTDILDIDPSMAGKLQKVNCFKMYAPMVRDLMTFKEDE